jgi:hypothetical protein
MQNRYVVGSYENINQGYDDYNGHVNVDPQRSGPRAKRVYQYNERCHNDNNGPSPGLLPILWGTLFVTIA